MKTAAAVIKLIIEKDPIAYESLGRGLLNANAYARTIQKNVNDYCKKDVRVNTIVTALLRLRKEIHGLETLVPIFTMEAITVKVGLTEMAFTKSEASAAVSKWLNKQPRSANEFFLTIEGNRETDFIFPERLLAELHKANDVGDGFNGCIKNLAAVTLSYPSTLTFVPNVGYTLMRALALRHINVVEVISTYSEVSFIVDTGDVDQSLDALKVFLPKMSVS